MPPPPLGEQWCEQVKCDPDALPSIDEIIRGLSLYMDDLIEEKMTEKEYPESRIEECKNWYG